MIYCYCIRRSLNMLTETIKQSPNVICICINKIIDGNAKGKFYNCYSKHPVYFEDIVSLFFQIDDLFNKINFPEASTITRSFFNNNTQALGKEFKKYMTSQEVTEQKGSKATFVVNVQFRQNSTWQGSVVWVDKNKTKNFRSALELLKLMDEALSEPEVTD